MLENHPRPPGLPWSEFWGVFLGLRTPKTLFVTAFGCWLHREPPLPPGKGDSTVPALPSLRSLSNHESRRCP